MPKCDSGKGLVIADGIGAAAFGITALATASSSSGVALLSALAGAAYVGAAFHGNATVEDCRRELGFYAAEAPPPLDGMRAPDMRAPDMRPPDILPPIAPHIATVGPVAPAPTPAPDPSKVEPSAPPETAKPPPVESIAPWREFWRELP